MITLRKPVMRAIGLPSLEDPLSVYIGKDDHGKYIVDRIYVKTGQRVKWIYNGPDPQPDEVVVFYPEVGNPVLRGSQPHEMINATSGIYHYSVFLKIGDKYHPVEGNSPPEMIIE